MYTRVKIIITQAPDGSTLTNIIFPFSRVYYHLCSTLFAYFVTTILFCWKTLVQQQYHNWYKLVDATFTYIFCVKITFHLGEKTNCK